MAWTKYQIIIALVMVTTGSLNTLTANLADIESSVGINGESHLFNHPFFQACAMFLGELLCLGAYYLLRTLYGRLGRELPRSTQGSTDFSIWIFLPPSLCDLMATSIMYIGLTMTYPSSFQMLRGAVIVFTGVMSVGFLQRKLNLDQWVGIIVVILGLAIVGVSDVVFPSSASEHHDTNHLITGDLLIVLAQIITATQMVLEEKFVSQHGVAPLQAVGLEGLFGFVVLGLLLIPMYFIPAGRIIFKNPNGNMEDALDAFVQISNNPVILVALLGTVFSIAFFNFAGVTVTKELSATTRMVLDSVRTLVVWAVSIGVSWQSFNWLQPVGFVVLVFGMALYNEIVSFRRCCCSQSRDTLPLLVEKEESNSAAVIS